MTIAHDAPHEHLEERSAIRAFGFLLSAAAAHPAATVLTLSTVALIVAGSGLGVESLWLDEAYTVAAAKLPTTTFVDLVLQREANMAPYYLLLRGWVVLGDTETLVRIPSLAAAVACVPFGFILARRLITPRGAVVATALLVVNAFFIEFAQEARGYSLVLLLSILATYLFVVGVDDRRPLAWIAYVLVGSLAVYVHIYGSFVLMAHFLSLVASPRERSVAMRTIAAVFGAITILVAPLVAFVLTTDAQRGWIPSPSVGAIGRAIAKLVGARSVIAAAILVPVSVALLWPIVLRVWSARRARIRSRESWTETLILLWAVAPILGGLAVSVVKPVFVDRYLIVALPAVVLGVSAGFGAMASRRLAAGLLFITIVATVSQTVVLHATRDHDDWRSATAYLVDRARVGDGIAFHRPFGKVPWGYYVEQMPGEAVPDPLLPLFDWRRDDLSNPRWVDPAALRLASRDHDRIWILVSQAPDGLISAVIREFDGYRVQTRSFVGVDVLLLERMTGTAR